MDEKFNKKESTITREKKAGFGFQLLVIFLFLAIGIGSSGYHYYQKQKTHLREAANNQLAAIADLKVAHITAWRNNLIEDATIIMKQSSCIPYVHQWLEYPDNSDLKEKVSAWLNVFQENKNYKTIILADATGKVRLSFPQKGKQLCKSTQQKAAEALQTEKIILSDFHQDEITVPIHLDLLVPLFFSSGNNIASFGVIVLEIDPYQILYPLIQTWPTPSKTAEALLVRIEETEVVFLNELRHRKNTALNLRFPISRKDLPAAMAVQGTVGIIEGNDYRGVPVIAALRKIPDSPWFLISKIDQQEVYGLIKKQSRFVAIIFVLLIALSGAGLALLWRQQTAQFYKKQHEADLKSIKSQEDLSHAQAVGNIGSWRLDFRRNELIWSDENHRIFGIPRGTPMTYETFLSTVHPDDRDYVDNKWKESLAGKPYDIEHRIIVDGHVKWVREKAYLEFDSPGALIGGFGITQDITLRKQTEEELKRSNENLEQFAYVASHDLQEPLRMMASYSELLERRYHDKLDTDANEFIGYIVDGAKRMQRLINDLLAYSRIGRIDTPIGEIDCNSILGRVINSMMPVIEESKAGITHDELPTLVGSESNFIQLFQNLIGNAIKFHGPELPRVHVNTVKEGNEWIFSVRDNGIGIESQYKDRIFLIFQRLHGRDQYPGTGIGLSICKKIVETQGGRIWMESEYGKGSTFYFTIPAKGGLKNE